MMFTFWTHRAGSGPWWRYDFVWAVAGFIHCTLSFTASCPLLSTSGSGKGPPLGLPQLQYVSRWALRSGRGVSLPQPWARRLQWLSVYLWPQPLHLVSAHSDRRQTLPPFRVRRFHQLKSFSTTNSHTDIWTLFILTVSSAFRHSACVMQERKIYVFGGWDTPLCYNDMYMLDLGKPHLNLKLGEVFILYSFL